MGDGYADFYDVTDDESVASDFDEEFSLDGDEVELDSADPETTDSDEEEEGQGQGSAETRTKQKEEQKERKIQHEKRFKEESEKIPRTLFVGNLPLSVTRKALAKLFAVYGAVESVRLRGAIPEVGKGRGLKKKAIIQRHFHDQQRSIFGYIVFKTQNSCTVARREMNGFELAGRHIRVDSAASGGADFKPQHCVFVGGLPYVADEETIRKHFVSCGEITNVRLVRDASGAPKGIGFVEFVDEGASVAALKKNGSEMEGRTIRVQRWSKKQQEKGGNRGGNQQSGKEKGGNRGGNQQSGRKEKGGNRGGNQQSGKEKGGNRGGNQQSGRKEKGGNRGGNQQSGRKEKGGSQGGHLGRGKPIRIPTSIRKEERAEYVKQILRKRRRQRNMRRRAEGEKAKEARKATDVDGKEKKERKEWRKKSEMRKEGKAKDLKRSTTDARVKSRVHKRKKDFEEKEEKQRKKKKS